MMTKYLLYIFCMLILVACEGYKSKLGDKPVSTCAEGTILDGTTCKVISGKYVYSSAYGGRSSVASAFTGANAVLSFAVPDGWYDGLANINATDSNLVASNIKIGTVLFGVTGALSPTASAACTVDAPALNAATCTAGAASYIYSTVNGGRSVNCTLAADPQNISTACWLNVTGKYVYTNVVTPNCTTTGVVSPKCNVTANNFWYTSAYNGRGLDCTNLNTGGLNASACWINAASSFIYTSATCATTGLNANSCTAQSGNFVYTSLYGGRDVDCTNNVNGNCYFNIANKSSVDANLTAANIRSGVIMFGLTGTNVGTSTPWASGMHRAKTTPSITITAESSTYAPSGTNTALPAGYHPVPKIATDNDGYNTAGTQVTLVNRTGWTTCGTGTTISAKMAHCAATFAAGTTVWLGSGSGNAGQSSWTLVSRTGNIVNGMAQEVWQDNNTQLLWSSLVSTGINWCKASGNSNNQSTLVTGQSLNEVDPNGYCSSQTYQEQSTPVGTTNPQLSAISACSELSGYTTTDAGISNAGKSGLIATSTPKVAWRLPTIYDFMVANANGIRFVMPDMLTVTSGPEWTATIYSTDTAQSWTFDSQTGSRSKSLRTFSLPVRCVGR